jgi:PD-(D/E)XK nuclease superfamily
MKIDNFALETFQTCPAKYFLRIKEQWVPARKRAALGFGGAVHHGLAEFYRTGDRGEAVKALVEKWPDGMPADDFRTREKAVQLMMDYFKTYPTENWKVIGAPDNPLVEKAFTIDTGMTTEDGDPILYGGILDGGIDFSGAAYVLEHKTTTRMGDTYFLQFKPNNQVTGYIWALGQLTSGKVGGAMINAMCIYKASASKFDRHLTNRTPTEIEAWLANVRRVCNDIKRAERTGEWEWRTKSCTMYGMCDYHNVHVLGTENEQQKRLDQDYVKSEWNHEERDD